MYIQKLSREIHGSCRCKTGQLFLYVSSVEHPEDKHYFSDHTSATSISKKFEDSYPNTYDNFNRCARPHQPSATQQPRTCNQKHATKNILHRQTIRSN